MRPDGKKQTFAQAVFCACSGIYECIAHERNVKIDVVCAVIALLLAFVFHITFIQWVCILLCIALVLSLELINTALENLTDLVTGEFNEKAALVKNCAAGACLVASVCSLAVGILIFAPYVYQLMVSL